MRKKVYHIHLTAPTHPNQGWEQGFLQNAYQYKQIDWMGYANTWGEVPLMNRILGEVELMQPNFVFMQLQQKSFFTNAFIKQLQEVCPVVVFNEDVRNDISWLIELAPDCVFMSNMNDVAELVSNGILANHMYPTYDETMYYRLPQHQKNYQKFGEIVFIGNLYSKSKSLNFPNAIQREEMVDYLQMTFGHRFKAYGMGTQNSYLKPQDEAAAYQNCRIAIGHNNFTRKDYQSDRMIRAVASGALFVPHFCEVSFMDNLWAINGSWRTFDQLGKIVDEYLSNKQVEYNTWKRQQEAIQYHSPMMKIIELQRKLEKLTIL